MQKITNLIGNTPIYQIKDTNIYVKLEKYNMAGSIKDRAVLWMLKDALAQGHLTSSTKLIEATSGNTGIALAAIGAALNYSVTIIMPENMSIERQQLIKAYGAKLILTPAQEGMDGALEMMASLKNSDSNYYSLNQFDNPANILAHYESTAPEILTQVNDIDIFVAAVGTGGTFSGVSSKLKEVKPEVYCVAVEPATSSVISGNKKGRHRIQGIGAGFIPKNYHSEYVDLVLTVTDEEAFGEMKKFGEETGILIGISSGANIAAAKKLAIKYPNKKIVTISPDGGEKYLSILEMQ